MVGFIVSGTLITVFHIFLDRTLLTAKTYGALHSFSIGMALFSARDSFSAFAIAFQCPDSLSVSRFYFSVTILFQCPRLLFSVTILFQCPRFLFSNRDSFSVSMRYDTDTPFFYVIGFYLAATTQWPVSLSEHRSRLSYFAWSLHRMPYYLRNEMLCSKERRA